MTRFDIYSTKATGADYLLDVQADFLSMLATRMVVPLLTQRQLGKPIERLHVPIVVKGKTYYAAINLMAAVPAKQCQAPVANVSPQSHLIVSAIDFLLQGF